LRSSRTSQKPSASPIGGTSSPTKARSSWGIVTGLTGQEILDRFPELDLPVSLPESEELPQELRDLPYTPNIFYFGPFSQEYDNLV
jgi:hypothetical protein